jgi:hypothetical protein
MRAPLIVAVFFVTSACATTQGPPRTVRIEVQTEPSGAAIEIGGVVACENTPCELSFECRGRSGGAKKLVAVPRGEGLFTQWRRVYPCGVEAGDTAKVIFNLTSPQPPEPKHRAAPASQRDNSVWLNMIQQSTQQSAPAGGRCAGLAPIAPLGCHMVCIGGAWQSVCP